MAERERLLAAAIALTLVGATTVAVLGLAQRGPIEAGDAATCARDLGRSLGYDVAITPTVAAGTVSRPDGSGRPVWTATIPATTFAIEVSYARDDGSVLEVRGLAPGGSDPLGRTERLTALGQRCRP